MPQKHHRLYTCAHTLALHCNTSQTNHGMRLLNMPCPAPPRPTHKPPRGYSSILPLLEANGGWKLSDIGAKFAGKDEALCALVQQVPVQEHSIL